MVATGKGNRGASMTGLDISSPIFLWSVAIFIGVMTRWILIVRPLTKLVLGTYSERKNKGVWGVWRQFKKMTNPQGKGEKPDPIAQDALRDFKYFILAESILAVAPGITGFICFLIVGRPDFEWSTVSFFTYLFVIITWLTWTVFHSLQMREFIQELERINSPIAPKWLRNVSLFKIGKKVGKIPKGTPIALGFGTIAITRKGLKKVGDLTRPEYVKVNPLDLRVAEEAKGDKSRFTVSNIVHDVGSVINRAVEVSQNTYRFAKKTVIEESQHGAKKLDAKLESEIQKVVDSHTQNAWIRSGIRYCLETIPVFSLYFFIPLVA